jgi:hypothetical protein
VVLALGSQPTYAQAHKKYNSKVAPAPAVAAPPPEVAVAPPAYAPAPAAMEEVPEPAAAPAPAMPPSYATGQPVQVTLDGVYVAGCTKVSGSGGNLSGQLSIELTESGSKIQNVIRFYTSEDCTGSVYAAVAPPVRVNRILAKRDFPLPAGQGERSVWYSQQPAQEGEMNFFGAVVKNPQNPAQMMVIFNNSTIHTVAIAHSALSEQFIFSTTVDGMYIVGSRSPGAALDAQGYPKSFGANSYYTRRQ